MSSSFLVEFPSRASMRALLEQGNWREADQSLLLLQAAFEQGSLSDVSLNRAYAVFDQYLPSISTTLEDWVEAKPGSYVARLARAKHLVAKAGFHRGYTRARDVKQEDWDIISACYQRAAEDLYRSLELTAKPILSFTTLMHMSIIGGGDFENQYEQAIAVHPMSMEARRMKMWRLRQEWGGSLDSLKDYVESDEHRDLKDEDKLWMQAKYHEARGHWFEYFENNMAEAERAYQKSLSIKELGFNLAKYGAYLAQDTKRIDEAVGYLERAMELEPENDIAKSNLARALIIQDIRNSERALKMLREAMDWGEWYAVQMHNALNSDPRFKILMPIGIGFNKLSRHLENPRSIGGWAVRIVARVVLVLLAVGIFRLFVNLNQAK